MGLFDLIFKRDDTVRIAVTGITSSGKTYLLKDFLRSLHLMGAKITPHDNPLYADFSDLADVTDNIRETKIYVARARNIYAATVELSGVTRRFMVVDTPGECFEPWRLRLFKAIFRALMDCKERIFNIKQWAIPGSKQVVKMVFLNAADSDNVSSIGAEEYDEQNYSKRRFTQYFDNLNEIQHLKRSGYEPQSKTEAINGESLLKRFLELNIDSALNAILDAWTRLHIDDYLASGQQGDSQGDVKLNRDTFKSDMATFFFLYYSVTATDVVVCDLVAKPKTLSVDILPVPDANSQFRRMVDVLASLGSEHDGDKRWYLAFKGIDSVMCQNPWREVWQTCNGNCHYAYSLLVMALGERLGKHLPIDNIDDFDAYLSDEVAAPHEQVKSHGDVTTTSDRYEEWCDGDLGKYFDTDRGVVISGRMVNGTLQSNPLKDHLRFRLDVFTKLTGFKSDAEAHALDVWGLQPHVYFCAHPIDDEFFIRGLKPGDRLARDFEDLFDPDKRIAFGTLQLTSDLLNRYKLSAGSRVGIILNYLYGYR